MLSFASRARPWPLALSLTTLVAVAACDDEPTAPTPPSTLSDRASVQTSSQVLTVTTKSGVFEVGSRVWAVTQVVSGGWTIRFDPSLAGDTITLKDELDIDYGV